MTAIARRSSARDLGRCLARYGCLALYLGAATGLASTAGAQVARGAVGSAPLRALITAAPQDADRVVLKGSVRVEARASNDRGRVPDDLPLAHMQLLLKRPAEREAALQAAIDEMHAPASPNYHHWLTAAQIAARFGVAASDLTAITRWLEQNGFVVNTVYPSLPLIDFSGTAGQVRAAFKTEVHYLDVGGKRHIANMSDPEIPAALAPAITGIVALHDFRPRALLIPKTTLRAPGRTRGASTASANAVSRASSAAKRARAPAYTTDGGAAIVVPADLAILYNLNTLFNAGTSGQGQSIVVIEDTDVYAASDWATFRTTLGLANAYPSGSFVQVHPASSGTNNCADPGVVAKDEAEATLDAEWASAAAPSAAIVVASCANTTTFGGLIALENLLSGSNPPAIVSISYGECEAVNGAAANALFSSLYAQAVALGTSVFVSTGDEGAASCNADDRNATYGIGVSGLASTPYNVAVGGTDFADTYEGATNSYWSSVNGAGFGSALSYVPEIPWDDSCANALLAVAYGTLGSGYGNGTPYGANGFCNSTYGQGSFLTTAAGSGGPSGCATGTPSTPDVVSGRCAGWSKPSWQSVLGNPADKVRDLPDVALFAANGVWGHYYVYCDSDTADPIVPGTSCSGAPETWSGGGGTSFATPIMAGIQALVNQSSGARQGNPNPMYYALAAAQYGAGGSAGCNSNNGNAVSASCVFYDVTLGDIAVNCTGTNDCYLPGGTYGVLSTSDSAYAPAYGAGIGWDFATGIGSINAAVLVSGWNTSDLTLSGNGSLNAAGQWAYAVTVVNLGPPTAKSVVLIATLPAGVSLVSSASSSSCKQSAQTVTCTLGNLTKNSSTALTLVVQPSASQAASVGFSVTAANGVLFPANDTLAIVIPIPPGPQQSDAPLPAWTYAALALALGMIARRRLRTCLRT